MRKAVKDTSNNSRMEQSFSEMGKVLGSRFVCLWSVWGEEEEFGFSYVKFGILSEPPCGNTDLEVCCLQKSEV